MSVNIDNLVQRQAAIGQRGSADVVASALDAEQHVEAVRETNGRNDIADRQRLDDEDADPAHAR